MAWFGAAVSMLYAGVDDVRDTVLSCVGEGVPGWEVERFSADRGTFPTLNKSASANREVPVSFEQMVGGVLLDSSSVSMSSAESSSLSIGLAGDDTMLESGDEGGDE